MEQEIKDLLEERIRTEFENLSSLKAGSNEHEKAVASLERLYKLNIEELENEREFRAKCDRNAIEEDDLKLKFNQLEEQRKTRWFNGAIQVGVAVAGWIAYDIWLRRGLKFEEEGTVRTSWLRNLISKMAPKK